MPGDERMEGRRREQAERWVAAGMDSPIMIRISRFDGRKERKGRGLTIVDDPETAREVGRRLMGHAKWYLTSIGKRAGRELVRAGKVA